MAYLKNPKGQVQHFHYYEIKGLGDFLTRVVLNMDEFREQALEIQKEVTRLSSGFEVLIHVANWKLIDPYCKNQIFELGKDSLPVMTDEFIGYSRDLDPSKIDEGIIDEKGFISFENFASQEQAAEVILMHEMIGNEDLYLKYTRLRKVNPDITAYDFLVSRPNVVGIKRINPADEKFTLTYVSANDGSVAEFLEYLKETNRIAELDIRVQPEADLMEIKGMGK